MRNDKAITGGVRHNDLTSRFGNFKVTDTGRDIRHKWGYIITKWLANSERGDQKLQDCHSHLENPLRDDEDSAEGVRHGLEDFFLTNPHLQHHHNITHVTYLITLGALKGQTKGKHR